MSGDSAKTVGDAAGWRPTPMQNVLAVLMSIAVAVFVISGTFCILLTPYPTHAFASMCVRDDISSASHDELVEVADQTLAYCNGDSDAELPLGDDYTISYTEDVMGHLDDVTVFFTGMKAIAVVSALAIVLLAACMVASARKARRKGSVYKVSDVMGRLASRSMLAGDAVVAALLLVIAVAAIVDFNSIFNLLHSLFFASGSWTFPSDSLLICALPESFWMAMALLWAFLLLIALVAILVAALVIRSHTRGALASR